VNTMSVGELAVRAAAEAPVAGAEAEPESAPARSRAETRRRLVEAGTALFAERGLHGATSARIARRAGVASGTFYLHFRDKHALFHEIVFDAFEQLRQRQERAATGHAPGSPAEQRAQLEDLVDFTEENRELIRVVFARGAESAAIAEELHERVALDIESRLSRLAAEGRAPAGLHPAAAAQARAATLIRVVAWWAAHPGRATREHIVSTLLHLDPGGLAPAGG